jgi:hypothetical protein
MEYTFPFKTCEEKRKFIAQPYSALVNFINTIVLLYFVCVSKTFRSKLLIGAVFAFEVFHTFSHAYHVSAAFQTLTIHSLTYLVNAAFLFYVYDATKKTPPFLLWVTLASLLVLDVYFLMTKSMIWYISTQLCMLAATSYFYFHSLSKKIQNGLGVLAGFSLIILAFFFNETVNCESMMEAAVLPYHAVLEILLFILFVAFAFIFS